MPTRAGFRNWETWYSLCNQHKLPLLGSSFFLFQYKVTGLGDLLQPSVSSDLPVPPSKSTAKEATPLPQEEDPWGALEFPAISGVWLGPSRLLPWRETRGAKQASDTWGAGSLGNEEAYWTPPMCQIPSSLGLFIWTSETKKLRPEGLSHLQRVRQSCEALEKGLGFNHC